VRDGLDKAVAFTVLDIVIQDEVVKVKVLNCLPKHCKRKLLERFGKVLEDGAEGRGKTSRSS